MQATSLPSATTTATLARTSTAALWTGRVLGGLVGLFLLFDGTAKIARFAPYVEATVGAGFPDGTVVPMGIVLVVSTWLFLVPRTRLLGALLLTAYLGGATATHVRLGQPFIFPVVFGVVLWASVVLRDRRVRALLRGAP